jgi:hypothetical protein
MGWKIMKTTDDPEFGRQGSPIPTCGCYCFYFQENDPDCRDVGVGTGNPA